MASQKGNRRGADAATPSFVRFCWVDGSEDSAASTVSQVVRRLRLRFGLSEAHAGIVAELHYRAAP
jgi:hypothetical protein